MNWPTEVTVAVIGLISTFLAVFAGALVSLGTTYLNRREQEQQRAEERQRWYSEFRLPRQLDVLSTLYADATALHTTLATAVTSSFWAEDEDLLQQIRQAHDLASKYETSSALAFIYLTEPGRIIVREFGAAAKFLALRLDPRLDDAGAAPRPSDKQEAREEKAYEQLTAYLQRELAAPQLLPSPSTAIANQTTKQ